jgi:formylmethanofuran dehydrogenase subunit D
MNRNNMQQLVVLVKAIMISGRTLGQGVTCESKMSAEFLKATSVCSISEADYSTLGISDKKNVLVKSDFGRAVLTPRVDPGLPQGLIFIPMGPWANALVGPDTGGCGTPQFKGVEVEISPIDSPVVDLRETFRGMGGMAT